MVNEGKYPPGNYITYPLPKVSFKMIFLFHRWDTVDGRNPAPVDR